MLHNQKKERAGVEMRGMEGKEGKENAGVNTNLCMTSPFASLRTINFVFLEVMHVVDPE